MKMIKMIKKYIYVMLFPLMIASCSDDSSNPLDLNLFSTQDDYNLGLKLDAEIKANSKEYPILNHANTKKYVQDMINEILKSQEIKYQNVFSYKVEIIKDDKTVNAFATPGGFIYVYTGLLKFLENEATLASVLAHEIAHAERRHSTKRMTKAYGVQILLGLLIGDNPSQITEIGANLLTGIAFLKNSRDDEYEADEYSFKYLKTSKWYPGGITYFFSKIKSNEGSSSLEALLSTHPMPQDRIDAVNKLLTDNKTAAPNESTIFAQRYLNFKNQIP
jgi:predicted Zn-dependent protease